jgi:CheY-like chemotaxis protein/chemotaxis protein CheY-P-specific phosphatase CheC
VWVLDVRINPWFLIKFLIKNIMKKKILIIDDDAFYCRVYQDEFGNYDGIEVSCVNNGKEGLEVIKKSPPDLILLDLVMPDYDGFWFLEERAKDPELKHIPIIVNSGVASYRDIEKVMAYDVEQFFSKLALSPEEFSKRIQVFLGGDSPEWKKSKLVDASVIKEGQKLNEVFVRAAKDINTSLSKFTGVEVSIGNLQATVAPINTLKDYLTEFIEGKKESTVIYSVLKPPIAAALLLIQNTATRELMDILEKKSNQRAQVSGVIQEIYSVVANTFLTSITEVLHPDKTFLFNPPMLSTPDLAMKVLRKDGFIAQESKVHFVFRQEYIIEDKKIAFNFILLLHKEGLKELGGDLIAR